MENIIEDFLTINGYSFYIDETDYSEENEYQTMILESYNY